MIKSNSNGREINPFNVIISNDKSYLLKRYSKNLWNFNSSNEPKENLFMKHYNINQQMEKIKRTSNYFRRALESENTKNIDLMG